MSKKGILLKTQRCCLKCDKKFPSEGPENRICDHCKSTEVFGGLLTVIKDEKGSRARTHIGAE